MTLEFRKVLLVAFLVSLSGIALVSYVKAIHQSERPEACDGFGYLQSRAEVVRAFEGGRWPDFSISDPQIERLLVLFRQSGLPAKEWEQITAPLAYHYEPASGRTINQYPPGTGALLTFFPEGRAVRWYSAWSIGAIVAILFGFAAFASARGLGALTLVALSLIGLAAFESMHELATVAARSYSITALFMPLILSLLAARRLPFVSGLLFGGAFLCRVTDLFCMPAFWAELGKRKSRVRWAVGFLFLGALPLAVYQHALTGAFWRTTYGPNDSTAPSLAVFGAGMRYYLLGEGASPSWIFLLALLASSVIGFERKREVLVSTACAWFISFVFFATHSLRVPYYMTPAALASLWALAIGVWRSRESFLPVHRARLLMAFVPMLLLFEQSAVFVLRNFHEVREAAVAHELLPQADHFEDAAVPAELLSPDAWIWSDVTSGSFWYLHRKAAFKIQYANQEIRRRLYSFARELGGRQFLIQDQDDMPKYMDELRSLGAILEPRGRAFGFPVFEVIWGG